MPKDIETIKNDAAVAQFRFALIAPVVQGLYPDASATAYYKRVIKNPLTLPKNNYPVSNRAHTAAHLCCCSFSPSLPRSHRDSDLYKTERKQQRDIGNGNTTA